MEMYKENSYWSIPFKASARNDMRDRSNDVGYRSNDRGSSLIAMNGGIQKMEICTFPLCSKKKQRLKLRLYVLCKDHQLPLEA